MNNDDKFEKLAKLVIAHHTEIDILLAGMQILSQANQDLKNRISVLEKENEVFKKELAQISLTN